MDTAVKDAERLFGETITLRRVGIRADQRYIWESEDSSERYVLIRNEDLPDPAPIAPETLRL